MYRILSIDRSFGFENMNKGLSGYWVVGNDRSHEFLLHVEDLNNMSVDDAHIIPTAFSPQKFLDIIDLEYKIILLPQKSDEIWIFDKKEKRWYANSIMSVEKYHGKYNIIGPKFANAKVWRDKIYLFPNRYPAIVTYDLVSDEIEYNFYDIERIIVEHEGYDTSITKKVVFHGDEAIFYSPISNCVYSFGFTSGRISVLSELEEIEKGNWHIEMSGDYYWLIDRCKREYCIRIDYDGGYQKVAIVNDIVKYSSMTFLYSVAKGDKIWLLPGTGDEIYLFDTSNMSISVEQAHKVSFGVNNGEQYKYAFVFYDGDRWVVYNWLSGKFEMFLMDDLLLREKSIDIPICQLTSLEIECLIDAM